MSETEKQFDDMAKRGRWGSASGSPAWWSSS